MILKVVIPRAPETKTFYRHMIEGDSFTIEDSLGVVFVISIMDGPQLLKEMER